LLASPAGIGHDGPFMRAPLVIVGCLLLAFVAGCSGGVDEVRDAEGRLRERGPVYPRDGVSVRHGVWTGFHPDGRRAWRVRFVRGTPAGLRQEWHPDGARAAEIKLGWDGIPIEERGAIKRWNPDGSPVPPPPEATPSGKDETHG
jgi:hypothetical protein